MNQRAVVIATALTATVLFVMMVVVGLYLLGWMKYHDAPTHHHVSKCCHGLRRTT